MRSWLGRGAWFIFPFQRGAWEGGREKFIDAVISSILVQPEHHVTTHAHILEVMRPHMHTYWRSCHHTHAHILEVM